MMKPSFIDRPKVMSVKLVRVSVAIASSIGGEMRICMTTRFNLFPCHHIHHYVPSIQSLCSRPSCQMQHDSTTVSKALLKNKKLICKEHVDRLLDLQV